MKNLWNSLSMRARIGLVIGGVLIVVITLLMARWSVGRDYQVLFADLNDQDAAAMVAELDRTKQPYELSADGTRILVPRESVHKTRLHLVSKNLPAHGSVGFEIFNNTDYGMTEFTQKVNYQRALQGELTRTILALDEVQSARVHLVLPEAGLFRRAENRAKASVTLALKEGRSLGKEQIQGIQRLVAASVPDIDAKNVTVLGSSGVALSSSASTQTADSGDWKLETKRQIEDYLTKKVAALVDRAVGSGRAGVTVDVLLDYDNVKTTDELVLAAPSGEPGERPAGVLVRERQTTRSGKPASADASKGAEVTSLDTEYQTGRRVHQIIATPGSVKRITVGVVLPPGFDPLQLDKLRELVSVSVGLDKARGDGVALHALSASTSTALEQAPVAPAAMALDARGAAARDKSATGQAPSVPALLALLLALCAVGALLIVQRRQAAARAHAATAPQAAPQLDAAQRERLLNDLRGWLGEPAAPSRG